MALIVNAVLEFKGINLARLFLTGFYPLGILWFTLTNEVFRPGSSHASPRDHLKFLMGARYAVFTIFAFSILAALVSGIVFREYLLGIGLMFVALGSLVFPEVSAAGTYGYLLAKGEDVAGFFAKAERYFLSRGMQTVFWLAVLLRRRDFVRRLAGTADFSIFLFGAYFLGWALLSVAGMFPFTLLGPIMGALVPLSSFRSFRKRTTPEEREKLSELLSHNLPKTFRISAPVPAQESR